MDRVMKVTRRQCQLALISAVVVVVCVFIGITMNLTTLYDENFDHMGIRTFCMFTVNSNILAAIAVSMTIPYTIDGLRKHNYHLPRWVTVFTFAGVTAVTLTFLISLFILSPVKGFGLSFTDQLIALVPVLIYAVLYYVMVVVIGEENGGWNDFYGFATRLPLWIPVTLIMPLTFAISSLIRFLHNRCFRRRKEEEAAYFKETFGKEDIRKAVSAMAQFNGSTMKTPDILIPRRVISIMLENNEGDDTLEELCRLYLEEYLDGSKARELRKMWI